MSAPVIEQQNDIPVIKPFHIFLSAMVNYLIEDLTKTHGVCCRVHVECCQLYSAYYHHFFHGLVNDRHAAIVRDPSSPTNTRIFIRKSYPSGFKARMASQMRLEKLLSVQTDDANLEIAYFDNFCRACRLFFGCFLFQYQCFDHVRKSYFNFQPDALKASMQHRGPTFFDDQVSPSVPLAYSVSPPLIEPANPIIVNVRLGGRAQRQQPFCFFRRGR
jgi:hypothetical protein